MDDIRIDQLLADSPHAMWVYDVETLRFLAVNDAAIRRYGFTLEEFLERTILEIRPPEDVAAVLAELDPEQRAKHASGPWRHQLKNGTIVFVEIAARTVRYRGRAARLIWAHDVTESREAHVRLLRSEERGRSLFEIASVGISTADLSGNLTDVNAAFVELTGFPREELLTKRIEDLFTSASLERLTENFESKVIDGVQATTYELDLVRADGATTPIEVTTQVLYEGGLAIGTLAVSQEITYRKELEEQLRQSQKMDAIGQLAGGIAHDFNNMLTAISGYAELIGYSFEEGDSRLDDVAELKRAASHAAGLTRQLLAFSRKQTLLPQRLDANEIVSELEPMLRRTLGAQIAISTELAADFANVEADPDQLTQVVLNIALNARDAMPDGGRLTISTGNVELRNRAHVAISISDTGCGMDEATRQHIFEPFFTTKDTGKGTGLGLATVYGVVSQSGGRIEVESEIGIGSTFRVLLPQACAVSDLVAA
ncbi:MAG TPA: PAS domain S-box protein [Gaiellaceae bacterium]|nr:PAS domain S-box protein [Gaiellaceae bacterium]